MIVPASFIAASMSSTPAPAADGFASSLRAERINRALIVAGVSVGSLSSIIATVALTIGAAMLVPDSWK